MISNKIYKKILTVALGTALFSLPLFTACESDVVDLQPIDKFSDLTAYSTPDRCELSVIGAYDAAQCGLYINTGNGRTRGYPFGAASILQGEMRGEDMNLTAVFYDYTYSATYNVSTANNVAMWETSFEAIKLQHRKGRHRGSCCQRNNLPRIRKPVQRRVTVLACADVSQLDDPFRATLQRGGQQ